ncbi:Uncharacterised protein [Neisseria gonorrhoeae]|uniref:Uncharacterized protein n=1 Tax=Neisseria gonorrhoeae TaxID=485 RepID=A0A378W1W9_NEIGO|nr:Uncharacterised protein [Neisseria gonorrhoeae]
MLCGRLRSACRRFQTVFGAVFRQNFVDLFEVGIGFFQQGFVFGLNQRTEQIDDFLDPSALAWKSLKSVWL